MAYEALCGTNEMMSRTVRLRRAIANSMEGSAETPSGKQGRLLEDQQDEVLSDDRAIRIMAPFDIALRQCPPRNGWSDWREDLVSV